VTRVVLTQPAPRVWRVAARLRALGHEPLALAQRRLVRCPEAPAASALLEAIGAGFDWVVFVSPGAIDAAFEGLGDGGAAAGWPDGVGVAVVGPGSAQALAAHGIALPGVRLAMPRAAPYDAAALLEVPPFDRPAGLRVLVVHGEGGRTDWMDTLRARGARVDAVQLYRSERASPDPGSVATLHGWASAAAPAVFVFTSAGAVDDCDALLAAEGLEGWARVQRALAVHPRILEALKQRGWPRTALVEPGEQALVAGIESR
jgi:uroporphyrinogen III methyltransferase/synthase